MKRLAAVLAAALLATGCNHDDCDPTVTVDWTFQNAEGDVTASCDAAGVDWIDVWVNGVFAATFDCFGPPGTVAVPSGASQVTVEGIDTLGRIAYRHDFTANASGCGDQLIAARPAEGFLEVDYAFEGGAGCAAPPSFIWLEVFDDVAGQVAFTEDGVTTDQQCALTPAPAPTYRLPVGSFTLLGIQEMAVIPGTGRLGVVAANCTDAAFAIAASTATQVFPDLDPNASFACF